MKRLFLCGFSLLFTQFVFGQDKTILLEGKIDKYPVVMELSVYDTTCEIRYFYISKRRDIYLGGSIDKSGNVKASLSVQGYEKVTVEKLDLKKTASGYTGIWNNGSKKLAVSLKETSADKFPNQYSNLPGIKQLKKESSYDYVKTKELAFTKESSPKDQPAELEWYKEKYSGVIMPRLKAGYDSAVLKKMNAALLEKHLLESKNSLTCSGVANGEYELSAGEIFIHKNIFSMNISVGYYCGGAHPDFGSEGLSFDGQTGNLLVFDEIFWFGKTKPPQENSDGWFEYRAKVFAPKVVELFKKIYPAEMKKPAETEEEGCDYTEAEVWNFPNWHFTKKGLYLGAVFARAARVCDSPEWSIIPYKDLKSYLNPGSKLKLPD
jgi:hypothetical protein